MNLRSGIYSCLFSVSVSPVTPICLVGKHRLALISLFSEGLILSPYLCSQCCSLLTSLHITCSGPCPAVRLVPLLALWGLLCLPGPPPVVYWHLCGTMFHLFSSLPYSSYFVIFLPSLPSRSLLNLLHSIEMLGPSKAVSKIEYNSST